MTNLMKPTNLNFTSGVLLTSVPDVFFLVEERSEAGQVSQPVRACEPGLGDLSKLTAPAYFFGEKLMFVGVMNFGKIQKNKVCRSEHFSVIFQPIFGHLDLVKLTNRISLKILFKLDNI